MHFAVNWWFAGFQWSCFELYWYQQQLWCCHSFLIINWLYDMLTLSAADCPKTYCFWRFTLCDDRQQLKAINYCCFKVEFIRFWQRRAINAFYILHGVNWIALCQVNMSILHFLLILTSFCMSMIFFDIDDWYWQLFSCLVTGKENDCIHCCQSGQ